MPSPEQARAWYSATDPVHGFDHILRVYEMAQRIARIEGANLRIVCAAALLHDVGGEQLLIDPKVGDENQTSSRANHQLGATEFAWKVLQEEGWNDNDIHAVQHCIRAHRFRDLSEQPKTLEAQVLFDADKLDAIGAIGVARAIAYAVKAGAPVFFEPSQTFIASGQLEKGERHSAFHEYLFKLQKISSIMYTQTGKALAKDRRQIMEVFFEKLKAETLGKS